MRVVALENLLVLGWEKVGLVKRMVWSLCSVWAGAAAEGRGMVMGVAVGGAVETWRYDVVSTLVEPTCGAVVRITIMSAYVPAVQ